MLLSLGADQSAVDESGQTALTIARMKPTAC
jgi:hypothetical protein